MHTGRSVQLGKLLCNDSHFVFRRSARTDRFFEVRKCLHVEYWTDHRNEEAIEYHSFIHAERLKKRFVKKDSWTHVGPAHIRTFYCSVGGLDTRRTASSEPEHRDQAAPQLELARALGYKYMPNCQVAG